jgi:hypothetical protein
MFFVDSFMLDCVCAMLITHSMADLPQFADHWYIGNEGDTADRVR